jgi:flavorubredoxin
MAGNRAMRAWTAMARELDVEILAPQHGAVFRGKEMVRRFYDWCDDLACGIDLIPAVYTAPSLG